MHKAVAAHLPNDYIKAFSDITKVTEMYQKQVDADKEKAGIEEIKIYFVKKEGEEGEGWTVNELKDLKDKELKE